mmetsp:Transcript_5607/g.21227  ORF Transcript_5607/g.21227 Transcript_5607/m.21227 type:complete len:215 (+) Transcript_5607:3230-3874(+)
MGIDTSLIHSRLRLPEPFWGLSLLGKSPLPSKGLLKSSLSCNNLDPGFLLPDLGDLLSLSCKSLFLLLKIAVRSWSPSPTLTPAMLILQYPMKSFKPPKSLSYTSNSTSSVSSSSSLPGGALKWKVSSQFGVRVNGKTRVAHSSPRYRTTTNGSLVLPESIASNSFAPMIRTKRHRDTTCSQSTVGNLGVGGIFTPPNRDASRKMSFSFSFPFS